MPRGKKAKQKQERLAFHHYILHPGDAMPLWAYAQIREISDAQAVVDLKNGLPYCQVTREQERWILVDDAINHLARHRRTWGDDENEDGEGPVSTQG